MLTHVETGIYTLKDFVRPGDGTFSKAFQRVANEMSYEGGECYVGPGVYRLDEPVIVKNAGAPNDVDVAFRFHAQAVVVVAPDADGFIFDGSISRIGTGHNLKTGIFGGKIWAGSNTAWTTGTLVKFVNTDGATVSGVHLRGGTRGIHYHGCWGALQRDVFVVHTHSSVCISDGTIKLSVEGVGGIYDCDVDAFVSWGQDQWGNGNKDISIAGQYLEQIVGNVINQSGPADHDWTIGPSNTFNDNGGNGSVHLVCSGAGAKVIANTFKAPRLGSGVGIVLASTASHCTVSLNTVRGWINSPNWLQANSSTHIVTENNVDGSGIAFWGMTDGNVIKNNAPNNWGI